MDLIWFILMHSGDKSNKPNKGLCNSVHTEENSSLQVVQVKFPV